MTHFKATYIGDKETFFTKGKTYNVYKDTHGYWTVIDDRQQRHVVCEDDDELRDVSSFINTHFNLAD